MSVHRTDLLANLRDVGGLRTTSGSLTRTGVLYRSDAPCAGDAPPSAVTRWPPQTVVDLRSPGEGRDEYRWPPAVAVHRLPLLGDAGAVWRGETPRRLDSLYERMLAVAAQWVPTLVRVVARADGPILVHCTGGKDRTGVAVAALLLAVGTVPAEVVADYTATAANLDRLLRRLSLNVRPAGQVPPLLSARAETIGLVVQRLTGRPGGAAGWLLDHGAAPGDVAALPRRLTAPDTGTEVHVG